MYNVELQQNETENQYLWRLGEAKSIGLIDMTWDKIALLINKAFYANELDFKTESVYRKSYAIAKKFKDTVFDMIESSGVDSNIDNKIRELQKERKKLSDARVDYNKLIRQEARKESYADMVKEIICKNVVPVRLDVNKEYSSILGDNDLLVHLTDIHTGIEISSWCNEFNEDVLKERIEYYTSKIIEIKNQHKSENCYIVIGEILSGIIHNNLRLQNNMDLMEQFKYISELISSMLSKLSYEFKDIYIYTTPGNHSRINPKKEDSLDGENMDVLLGFYLKARMQNHKNIHICDNTIEPEIAMFSIRGTKVFAAHGHKDSPSNVVQNFTLMFGIRPDIVLLGHRHTNGLTTVQNTKVIESGCVSGADNYAVSIRKTTKPEQTISVVNQDGLVCLYDIQL